MIVTHRAFLASPRSSGFPAAVLQDSGFRRPPQLDLGLFPHPGLQQKPSVPVYYGA